MSLVADPPTPPPSKSDGAFRTIGEVAAETGVPQHVLRYWETRFPQLRPVQRAGKRRYYRPEDVALVRRIRAALDEQGYTVRGVQQLLAGAPEPAADEAPAPEPAPPLAVESPAAYEAAAAALAELQAIRALLADALARDGE